MSKEYEGQNPIDIAKQAEADLNTHQAKQGQNSASDSANDSGVNEGVTSKFPGSEVKIGSEASGGGDNRVIPESEGGSINPGSGQPYKARDFEGSGGPEDKAAEAVRDRGGDDDVRAGVRNQAK